MASASLRPYAARHSIKVSRRGAACPPYHVLHTTGCRCGKGWRAVTAAGVLSDECNHHAWYASCNWGRKGTCGNIFASLQLTPVKTRV